MTFDETIDGHISAEEKAPPATTPAASATAPVAIVKLAGRALREFERSQTIAECSTRMNALLDEYDCGFNVTQIMTLGPNGGPLYRYQVDVVSR